MHKYKIRMRLLNNNIAEKNLTVTETYKLSHRCDAVLKMLFWIVLIGVSWE